MPLDRTGLLIIRAWLEQGSAKLLGAQIPLTAAVATGFMTRARIKAVSAAVEA